MRTIAVSCAFLLALAGCAGQEGAPLTGPTDTPVVVDEAVGGVEGTIVDDTISPIVGALVGITETGATATTDEVGHFAFGGLEPGTYTLVAQKLGYESNARRVEVQAGGLASVQLILAALSTEVPYSLTLTFAGLIECAWGVSGAGSGNCIPLQFVFQQIGNNPTATRIIGLFPIPEPEKVEQGVFELTWNPSAATTGGQLLLVVELEGTGVVTGKVYGRAQGSNPVRVVTDAAPFKELKPQDKLDRVQTRTFPATTNPPTFVVNQRFSVFATACYVAECPEDFTALADA